MLLSRAKCATSLLKTAQFKTPVRWNSSSTKASIFASHDDFIPRHIGVTRPLELKKMLTTLGYNSIDDVINQTVPQQIRRTASPLKLTPAKGEQHALKDFTSMMKQNKLFRSHIGLGYYNTYTPTVILRNILENPGWYTPYTPYQAEIAQGRLEMLLNYQTMVSDLTGLPVANSSLLDEGTAAAEAMFMAFAAAKKRKTFLIADDLHPQTIEVLKTRAVGYGINVKVSKHEDFDVKNSDVFGVIVQYPATDGRVCDFKALANKVHENNGMILVASDLLALTVLQPPGEWGADVVLGSAQRFGFPLGFGGPHAAFLSTTESNKRRIPGRIIGLSRDSRGKPALRMAMQTREQHIRRDKATSNICTAQALLANTAAAYGIYHGPEGLKRIGQKVNHAAKVLANGLTQLGYTIVHTVFFDTVKIKVDNADVIINAALKKEINLRKFDDKHICISFDETVTSQHINDLFTIFASVSKSKLTLDADVVATDTDLSLPSSFARGTLFMQHPVFNMYHSELEMTRYLYSLQMKDLSLCTAMIPLGSCTMKLNATSEMIPITMPEVNSIHPFTPHTQTLGYQQLLQELQSDLCDITGFAAVSLQPNAGSQGEYAGLLAIKAYHESRGDKNRNICLIPTSAHGTNPASAAMLGFKIIVVSCDEKGNIDVVDLKAKVNEHSKSLGALMVTYPSTHGVFEEEIVNIISLIHENGGQVYMDGANLNAQVGLTSPGFMGADVCHMNLHKTFCIPHGGGGPGMGPIGVAKHLAPFLPNHPFLPPFEPQTSVGPVASAPFSSASILPISYMYIKMMGSEGLTLATKMAILNANYMRKRLEKHYKILYGGTNGNCAHEFIIDLRDIKSTVGITEEDVAKRLQDYNFHAPTMSFPVVGTLMIEPTESESLYELDRFCDAMIQIKKEIDEVENGTQDKINNTLKNAPHTADVIADDKWDRPYSREKAAYPLSSLKANKFWPSVGRIDNVFGDRNVICTCPPIESYQQ